MRDKIKGKWLFVLLSVLCIVVLTPANGCAPPARAADAKGAAGSPAAVPPWIKQEVDTVGNRGQHVALAFDRIFGDIWVSYYDAGSKDLRVAHQVGNGGNCGPSNSWFCETVDSGGDVGQYSSITVEGGNARIAYFDASNGYLKYAYLSAGTKLVHIIDIGLGPGSRNRAIHLHYLRRAFLQHGHHLPLPKPRR